MPIQNSPLGKTTSYIDTYAPHLLFPYERNLGRALAGIKDPLPFKGGDLWNGYELSWLNSKGKPEVALVELYFPCTSPFLIESKSLKLYLNSFNQTPFESLKTVRDTLRKDLTDVCGETVTVTLVPLAHFRHIPISDFPGTCLDSLDISTSTYHVDPSLLRVGTSEVEETIHSHLLKTNCLATGQPDWGSVLIRYTGLSINHESLLKYI
jgi:7-cyano-7-deazaguanine reductase